MSDIMQLREFLVAEEQCCGGVTVIGGAKAATFFSPRLVSVQQLEHFACWRQIHVDYIVIKTISYSNNTNIYKFKSRRDTAGQRKKQAS